MPYSSSQVLKALESADFVATSQRGSHLKLKRTVAGVTRTVIIAHPSREIPLGTLASILRQAGLSRAEFEAYL